jgi:hypothetical protein
MPTSRQTTDTTDGPHGFFLASPRCPLCARNEHSRRHCRSAANGVQGSPSNEFHSPTSSNSASRIRSQATRPLHSRTALHSRAREQGPCLVAACPYLEVASGSIPLFLIASKARAEVRNSISRLERSISLEPATMAAENTCTNWISGAIICDGKISYVSSDRSALTNSRRIMVSLRPRTIPYHIEWQRLCITAKTRGSCRLGVNICRNQTSASRPFSSQ